MQQTVWLSKTENTIKEVLLKMDKTPYKFGFSKRVFIIKHKSSISGTAEHFCCLEIFN
jgi:hypothetical protein